MREILFTTPEELNKAIVEAILSTDFSKFPDGTMKLHKAKDADGNIIEGKHEGVYLTHNIRVGKPEPLTLDGELVYPSSMQVGISAFKIQTSPYSTKQSEAKEASAPLTFDAIKAALASASPKVVVAKAEKA